MNPPVVLYQGEPRAIIAELAYLGLNVQTLAGLPRRAYSVEEVQLAPPLLDHFVDARTTEYLLTPAAAAAARASSGESWLASTRRAQHALLAWFLLAEDRQRRLLVREVAPLVHQLSLVEHVLDSPDLQRVLIGDEVGLGKTVEAGLIAQRLLLARPDLRVLYLAPARLVRNVVTEFRRLGVDARRWVAGGDSDARVEVQGSVWKEARHAKPGSLVDRFKVHHPEQTAQPVTNNQRPDEGVGPGNAATKAGEQQNGEQRSSGDQKWLPGCERRRLGVAAEVFHQGELRQSDSDQEDHGSRYRG